MAAAALLPQLPRAARLPLRSAARPVTANGALAYSMAMHVHSSFSEYDGSMDAQLWQATQNAVDVLWWTDHDQRLNDLEYRKTVHFTSLTKEQPALGEGLQPWKWEPKHSGPLASSSGSIVQNPCSPNDPVAGGALYLAAASQSTSPAMYGFLAVAYANNYQCTLMGQSLSIDVLLNPGWRRGRGYLELAIGTSRHEATGGRPVGDYALSYRLVPAGGRASRTAQGNLGVITIPVDNSAGWATVTVTPSDDIAALWPDLDYRDFGLAELSLHAVSLGDAVSGYFDYLRFIRSLSGEVLLQQQHQMGARLAAQYPSVIQRYGLEMSLDPGNADPHLNWFGSGVTVLDYREMDTAHWLDHLAHNIVPHIHAAGGLASYNHPFGVNWPTNKSPNQDTLLATTAKALLPSGSQARALGCDLLEVGYPLRGGPPAGASVGGVDLAHHLALWDVMSRNAVFLTGNGTNDDHWGKDWSGARNNWATSVWAPSTSVGDLLTALAAGRAWCGSMSQFAGPAASLDLVADGCCPMGSVSLSALTARKLTVTATGIPAGGSLVVLQGAVDYADSSDPTSNAQPIASYTAAQLASNGGSETLTVDTTAESYLRTVVLDADGTTIIGASNPVWLLHNTPPNGIPRPRQASC
jgi:hypothetical protein